MCREIKRVCVCAEREKEIESVCIDREKRECV